MLREDLAAKMASYQIFEVLKSLMKRSFHAGNSQYEVSKAGRVGTFQKGGVYIQGRKVKIRERDESGEKWGREERMTGYCMFWLNFALGLAFRGFPS